MLNTDTNLLTFIQENPDLKEQLFSGHFGLEKENLRVTPEGELALTPHPEVFGPKEDNPYIKTDFSESQIEMITPVCDSIDTVYQFLENLQKIISLSLENGELLWPNSNPPLLPDEAAIPIAEYKTKDHPDRLYREHLAKEYGKKIQLLSGIHYNFSFPKPLIEALYKEFQEEAETFDAFQNRIYLKAAKYFMQNRWLLVYLTGAGSIYLDDYTTTPNEVSLEKGVTLMKDATSLRNSPYGYKNKSALHINYDTFDSYITSIADHIADGKINSMREFYNPIRLKNGHTDQSLDSLATHGVEYLEVRAIDLDPLEANGISKDTLYFIQLFFITGILTNKIDLYEIRQEIADDNEKEIALYGLAHPKITLSNGKKVDFVEAAITELDRMLTIAQILAPDNKRSHYTQTIHLQKERLLDVKKTIAAAVETQVRQEGFLAYHLNQAKKALTEAETTAYQLSGYEDLELSTKIVMQSAIKKGIKTEVLDRSENFIRLIKNQQIEYVKQATKTAHDNYISVLLMENKVITKKILAENNIRVPFGKSFINLTDALQAYDEFSDQAIVIKPKSTNFGIGISIFKESYTKEDYHKALEIAFSHDSAIIIEEFIPGNEYRFLVIDDKAVAVLLRVPANVTGDGFHTIKELIAQKNNDPLRGENHLKPLEKIQMGPEETLMLSMQNLNLSSVPSANQIVYLRENSNVSTGGDSIDVTDKMASFYKKLAVQCAQTVDASFCGVDIIVPPNPHDYEKAAVIELNYNPAVYMHCFPYQGKARKIGDMIVDYLFAESN
ncbi:bifunctional glutamate--cysteine ligase GshA/glutathione synthetase GshB [Listeria sp. PSOL-1]|uniref:bifunctional glutamate--cysteine ligase GshA/glutathione synthetase GshB n=1 Tax=Listeria sp. PSOL-1 TaxID=1844999 RepID=UPI0013D7C8A3|nr:bifunctional glutamate--cysteine ligase GshA/glutathione synthetase GshB [Listeria sp. PSOL-1]